MNRLLSVNSYHYYRGGSDIVYLNHAALFERKGWSNAFYSMQHPKNLPSPFAKHFAARIDYEDGAGLKGRLVNAGRVIYSRDAQKGLAALLDENPVDIAHFHIVHHHLSPSVLVEASRRGIPTVMTAHDLKLACPNYKMMNQNGVCERCKDGRVWNTLRYRCIKGSALASGLVMIESGLHKALDLYAKHLSAVVAPSKFYREKLLDWGWAPEKVHYIPNFVSLPPPAEPGAYGDFILYFGRLAPEKGLATLIRASAQSKVPVVLAGSGPDADMLQALATELKAPVTFLGFLSGQDLWDVVTRCRAVVLPSEWYENAPISVLEAFARYRPVIGARIGGIPELIEPGVSGWHFPAGNAEALAATLTAVRATPDAELAELGRNARAFVEAEFSEELYYTRMCALYAKISSRA